LTSASLAPDIICLSHLRWQFVFQRPQHLMTRFAQHRRVFFVEEPVETVGPPHLERKTGEGGVHVIVPHLPPGTAPAAAAQMQRQLLDELIEQAELRSYVLWYYTPLALDFTAHLRPVTVVYDCMDELSAFQGASPALVQREAALLTVADVVFTGGHSLYEAKRDRHFNVHAVPSSVDVAHFAQARDKGRRPTEVWSIPHPQLGFAGVIDERMDLPLLRAIAELRPTWHLAIIGPVVKIDAGHLPVAPNIHYLGMKRYQDLPLFMSSWDVGILPFARNQSTRYISPTKTPEYLAAGLPVVSTSIRDVVRPYGQMGLARIADDPGDFVAAVEEALAENAQDRQRRADAFLALNSWDQTWKRMSDLIDRAVPLPTQAADCGASP
jgi:UDP-galactopyranose mutase